MVTKKQIIEFLKENELAVLATVDGSGQPMAAAMAYTVDDQPVFYLETGQETRKHRNLLKNSRVSLVVGVSNQKPTVQIDGEAKLLSGGEARKAWQFILSKHPEWRDYYLDPQGNPGYIYLVIEPHRLAYSDFSTEPPTIEVVNF